MKLKTVLMAGAAICTVAAAPTFAGSAPHFHVVALHAGAITKTMMHTNTTSVTSTLSIATSVSVGSDYKVKTPLLATFYTYESNSSICDAPTKEKLTLSAKRTKYARLSTTTETYNEGCPGAQPTFYGDVYDLNKKSGKNKTDTFTSILKANFIEGSEKFKGTLSLDVSVAITP